MKYDLSIMYSGGLDSYIAYFYAKDLGYNPILINLDLGHPYADTERKAMSKLGLEFTSMQIDLFDKIKNRMVNQIIPSRNILLSVVGSMFSGRVWICALDGEQLGKENDKSPKFYKDTSNLLSYTNNFFQDNTIVESPFSNKSKKELIQWALLNNVPDLDKTSSCYSESGKCGECLACYKRYTAFLANDIEEEYLKNPLESDYAKEIDIEMPIAIKNKDFSRFTKKRMDEWQGLKTRVKRL